MNDRGSVKAVLLIILAVLLVAAIGLYGTVKGTYNELVKLDEGVKGKWAQVENQLQRRFDLIPNLVNTVKGYAEHERGVFIDVTEARSRVGSAGNIPDKIDANNELSGAISRLLLVVENYPQLKANENFIRLQDELAGTENRIATERMRYNDSVVVLNTKLRTFPTNIIAGFFDFEKAVLFDAPEEANTAPKVEF